MVVMATVVVVAIEDVNYAAMKHEADYHSDTDTCDEVEFSRHFHLNNANGVSQCS